MSRKFEKLKQQNPEYTETLKLNASEDVKGSYPTC